MIRRVILIAALAAPFGVGCRQELPSECEQAISASTARHLFDVLNKPAGDCKFEGVNTSGDTLEATWSRNGKPLPSIRVTPTCNASTKAGLTAHVPDELAQCPAVGPLVKVFLREVDAETAVPANPKPRAGARSVVLWIVYGLVLAGAVAVVVWQFRRKTRPSPAG